MTPELRKSVFDTVRPWLDGKSWTSGRIAELDAVLSGMPQIAPGRWHISDRGVALIKRSEGLRLKAYRCPADVPTIGYGSTGAHVVMGMAITEAEAETLLRKDLERFEKAVNEMAPWQTQGQYDAAVSFAFNLSASALKDSSLLKKHLAGDYAGARAEFSKWNKAGGKVLPGLVTRRADEAAMYGAA